MAPIVTQEEPEHLTMSMFGLTPQWAKKKTYWFNARAEGDRNKENDPRYLGAQGIIEKPAFRKAIRSQRCLVGTSKNLAPAAMKACMTCISTCSGPAILCCPSVAHFVPVSSFRGASFDRAIAGRAIRSRFFEAPFGEESREAERALNAHPYPVTSGSLKGPFVFLLPIH